MKRNYSKILIVVSLFICCMILFSPAISAAPTTGSLTLNYDLSNVSFSLYQVGTLTEDGSFSATEDFKNYNINLNNLTGDDLRSAATTLAANVAKDQLTATKTAATDEKGNVSFAGLSEGVYLATGEVSEKNNLIYTPSPTLAYLPATGTDGAITYDLSATVKYETEKKPAGDETTEITVVKVWKNDSAAQRPKSVEITLLKDNQTDQTITLNEDNNWKYTFKDLPATANYQVTENTVPSGYTVAITKDGNVYTVTNTAKSSSTGTTTGKIPQTGQLWWPVSILAAAGLVCFLIGFYRRSHRANRK